MHLVSAQKGLFLYDGWIQCVSVLKKIPYQRLMEKATFSFMSIKLPVFMFKQQV